MDPVSNQKSQLAPPTQDAAAKEKEVDPQCSPSVQQREAGPGAGAMLGQKPGAQPYSHSVPRYQAGNQVTTPRPSLAGAYRQAKDAHASKVVSKREKSNQPDKDGRTPLMRAAVNGDTAQIRLLLDQGADPTRQDAQGDTALMHAAANGHGEIVRILAENNASLVHLENKDGETAAALAAKNGKALALMTLLYRGADMYETSNGKNLLMLAAQSGDEHTMRSLVREFKLRNESALFPDDQRAGWENMLVAACAFAISENCSNDCIRVLIEDGLGNIGYVQKQKLMALGEQKNNLEVGGMLIKSSPLLRSSFVLNETIGGKGQ